MYIGNSPATGDNNSFKILDDISSYTLTFNGSSGSVVSTTNDTITQNNHRFLTGQRVTYTTAGTAIGGLTSGNVYFIIKTDYSIFFKNEGFTPPSNPMDEIVDENKDGNISEQEIIAGCKIICQTLDEL